MCVFDVTRGKVKNRLDARNIYYNRTKSQPRSDTVALGTLVSEEPCYGVSATAVERNSENQPKYIRITDFDDYGIKENNTFVAADNYAEKHFLREKDVLFARSGSVGRTYYYDGSIGKAVFAGYCIRFRFDEQKIIPKFVYWYTKTKFYLDWVNGIQRPAVQPNINKEEFKSFEIPVLSFEAQRKAVAYMDGALLKLKENLRQAEETRRRISTEFAEYLNIRIPQSDQNLVSTLKLRAVTATVTKRLDPKCYSFKFSAIRNELERTSFRKYKLSELTTDNKGGDWGLDPEYHSGTHVKCLVLRATEISNKDNINIREDKAQFRQIDKNKLAAMNLEVGDIIIEKSGGSNDQPVGRVIYVENTEYNGYPLAYSNFLTKIKVNCNLVDPYYLFEFLRFVYGTGLTEVMQNQTNGIRNLITEEFFGQTIIVPDNNAEIGRRMKALRLRAKETEIRADQDWQNAKSYFENELLK